MSRTITSFSSIVVILHALSQGPALFLGGVMFGSIGPSLEEAVITTLMAPLFRSSVPFRSELDDLFIQIGSNAARHAHDHALAGKHFLPRFKVANNILGNILDALLRCRSRPPFVSIWPWLFGFR